MAFWDGLLGGGGGDEIGLYDELLTDRQKAALRSASSPFSADNLARMSVALAKAAEPSLTPKGGGIASAIAAAAGATAGGRDEQVQALLKAGLTAQQVQEIKRRLALQERIVNSPIYQRVLGGAGAAAPPGMPAGVPGAPSPASPMVRPGPAVAPPPIPDPPVPPGAVPPLGIGNTRQSPLSPPINMTGLLGGDTQMAALPPPDELIPSGEPGVLAALQAAYGGGGAPGLPFPAGAGSDAAPTLRLASADPFLARNALRSRENPQGGPISWQNEWPAAGPDAPADLGETRGRLPANLPPPVMGGTAARPVAGLTGSAWEIANNNFGGLRKPGVVAGPSQGGFQSFDSPEAGVAAISRQLDRYASGATTGKPLTTIREIVSTWAPPHENPTATLIARASRIVGADPDAPLDVSDPQIKAKLIEATIANEQGGRVPVGRDLINSVASRPAGDEVIPSGRGVPASALRRTQAGGAPTGAAGPFMPAMPDFRNLPGVSGGGIDTPIPGLGASPRELMVLDSLAEMAKMGTPFKGFLESYYKTPEYLQDAARAAKMGTLPAEIFQQQFGQRSQYAYDLLKDLAKDNMTMNDKGEIVPLPEAQRIRTMNKEEEARVQQEWAARLKTTDVQVMGPNGPVTVPMTEYDRARKAAEAQQRRAMAGPGSPYVPQLGDIVEQPALTESEKKVQGIVTKEFEDVRGLAIKAPDIVRSTHTLRRSLDSGAFTGLDANWSLFAAKLGDTLGVVGKDTQDKIANTEVFISEIGKEVLEQVKALKPASNIDLQFAAKIAGGQNLSAGAIRRLLDLREELARLAIEKHNDLVKGYSPRAFEGGRRELPMPEPYRQQQGTSPSGRRWSE